MSKDKTLLVRLDEQTRNAFHRACKANDQSSAQVLRKFIRGYIKDNNHNLLLDWEEK